MNSAVQVNIMKPDTNKEKVTFRNLKDVDMDAVFSDLELNVENCENIESIVEDLEKKLDELIEKVAPKKTKVLTDQKKTTLV